MMRSASNWAVAVRTPEGNITEVVQEITSPMSQRKLWRLPIIRGVIALGESLAIGFRALAISANVATQETDEDGEIKTVITRGQISSPSRDRDRVRADALQGRAGAPDELASDRPRPGRSSWSKA